MWIFILNLSLINFSISWSPGSSWPFQLLGNSLLFRTELVPIKECRVYFPRPPHRSIPLNFNPGLAQVSWNSYHNMIFINALHYKFFATWVLYNMHIYVILSHISYKDLTEISAVWRNVSASSWIVPAFQTNPIHNTSQYNIHNSIMYFTKRRALHLQRQFLVQHFQSTRFL